MKELFLIVWIASICVPNKPDPFYGCSNDLQISHKITSSKSEVSRLYEEHKETAKVFRCKPVWVYVPIKKLLVMEMKCEGIENCYKNPPLVDCTEQTIAPAYQFEDRKEVSDNSSDGLDINY